jgi:hypothetical protein
MLPHSYSRICINLIFLSCIDGTCIKLENTYIAARYALPSALKQMTAAADIEKEVNRLREAFKTSKTKSYGKPSL